MKEKLYCPVYYGKHNYNQYERIKEELLSIIDKNLIINVDFLFDIEVSHYIKEIFIPIILNNEHKSIIIEGNNRKRITSIKRILRKNLIKYSSLRMRNKNYYIKIEE